MGEKTLAQVDRYYCARKGVKIKLWCIGFTVQFGHKLNGETEN